jgi:hypothetical protein
MGTGQGGKDIGRIGRPYLPKQVQCSYWLLGTDVTPQPRPHAKTLEDRGYVHQPNPIKSNKPITIGHAYSTVVLFPEEESEHGPVWAVPLSTKRVKSSEDKEMVRAGQVQTLLEDETLSFTISFVWKRRTAVIANQHFWKRTAKNRIW